MDPRQKARQLGYSDQEIDAYLAKKATRLPGVVNAGLPIAGGVIGGAVGGPPVSILGAMGGKALATMLQRMVGDPDAPQSIGDQAMTLGKTGAAQLAGEGAGAALRGLVNMNPVGMLDDAISALSKKSPHMVPKAQLINEFRQNILPKMKVPGQVPEITKMANKVEAQMPEQIMNAPGYTGQQINELRKLFNTTYNDSDLMSELQKGMGRIVRKAQVEKNPAIGKLLGMEKFLGYTLPDVATSLPFGIGQSLSKILPLLHAMGKTTGNGVSRLLPPASQIMAQ